MIKDITHVRLRHSIACKRVINAVEMNPEFFKGLKIPPKEDIVNDNSHVRNVTFYGIILAFLIKVFH